MDSSPKSPPPPQFHVISKGVLSETIGCKMACVHAFWIWESERCNLIFFILEVLYKKEGITWADSRNLHFIFIFPWREYMPYTAEYKNIHAWDQL